MAIVRFVNLFSPPLLQYSPPMSLLLEHEQLKMWLFDIHTDKACSCFSVYVVIIISNLLLLTLFLNRENTLASILLYFYSSCQSIIMDLSGNLVL